MNYNLSEDLRQPGMMDYVDDLARVYVGQHYLLAAFIIVGLIVYIVWTHMNKEGFSSMVSGRLPQHVALPEAFDNLLNNRYDHGVMNCDQRSVEEKSLPWMGSEGFKVDDATLMAISK